MQFLFVDSNVFLQCRPLKDLDWDRLVGPDEVTILVPSAVLTELDKHKSDGNSRRAQKARRALQFLNSLLEAPDDRVIVRTNPAKVVAQFAPAVSGDASTSNDDSILFEVAEMARTSGNHSVGLVTHDTNLKVKAKRKGLRFFAVPDEWLLAPEPDEREKRMRVLEEEVALLKKQTPVFEITVDGSQEIEITVPSYEPLTPDTVERLMEAMTARFPLKTDFSITSTDRVLSASLGLARVYPPSQSEIDKYQIEEYPKWEQRLRSRLERLHSKLRFKEATADIRFLISNTGSVPGEHVQIAVKVSEGFVNIDREHHEVLMKSLRSQPEAPSPPEPRRASLDFMHGHSLSFPQPFRPEIPFRPVRDEFYRKSGEDIDIEWVWECENMRHGGSAEEFSIRVGMSGQSNLSGGQMVIEVSAENLPKPAMKNFRIKISNAAADTERAAKNWLGLNDA